MEEDEVRERKREGDRGVGEGEVVEGAGGLLFFCVITAPPLLFLFVWALLLEFCHPFPDVCPPSSFSLSFELVFVPPSSPFRHFPSLESGLFFGLSSGKRIS